MQGSIYLYWDIPIDDEEELLRNIADCLQVQKGVGFVNSYESDGYDAWMRDGELDPEGDEIAYIPSGPIASMKIPQIFGSRLLYMDLSGKRPRSHDLFDSLERRIPKDISEGFSHPFMISLNMGRHTVWQRLADADPILYGRPTLSLQIWNYGDPAQWLKYKKLVEEDPVLHQVRADLDKVLCSSKMVIFWH